MARQLCAFGLLAIATCLLPGCGDGLPPTPSTLKVTGTVTYDGSALEGATVIFSDGVQYSALGTTDASGRFTLTTKFHSQAEAEGAPPRKYKVTIKKMVLPDGMTEEQYQAKKERIQRIRESGDILEPGDVLPKRSQLLPAKYSSMMVTVLEANVTTKGANDFPFKLDK